MASDFVAEFLAFGDDLVAVARFLDPKPRVSSLSSSSGPPVAIFTLSQERVGTPGNDLVAVLDSLSIASIAGASSLCPAADPAIPSLNLSNS